MYINIIVFRLLKQSDEVDIKHQPTQRHNTFTGGGGHGLLLKCFYVATKSVFKWLCKSVIQSDKSVTPSPVTAPVQ